MELPVNDWQLSNLRIEVQQEAHIPSKLTIDTRGEFDSEESINQNQSSQP